MCVDSDGDQIPDTMDACVFTEFDQSGDGVIDPRCGRNAELALDEVVVDLQVAVFCGAQDIDHVVDNFDAVRQVSGG
jgi:hypothetical protein